MGKKLKVNFSKVGGAARQKRDLKRYQSLRDNFELTLLDITHTASNFRHDSPSPKAQLNQI